MNQVGLSQILTGILLATVALVLLDLHTGPWWLGMPSTLRISIASVCLATYLVVCLRCLRPQEHLHIQKDAVLFAWASQTGFAKTLAERSAAALQQAGCNVQTLPLEWLDNKTLHKATCVLFVISTTGEGDPPDHAQPFVHVLATSLPLPQLRYGLIALGDRRYKTFCAFGRRLDHWLTDQGAEALFERIEVDNGDPQALRKWQQQLTNHIGDVPIVWRPQTSATWRLQARQHCNPDSPGGAVYRLRLVPDDGHLPFWQAGDIAEVIPCHPPCRVQTWLEQHTLDGDVLVDGRPLRDWLATSQLPETVPTHLWPATLVAGLTPLSARAYSIASIPEEGHIALLLRYQSGPNGTPGLGSTWLCKHAPLEGKIALRIRTNPSFHGPPADHSLILIGNGTGIAGLRAHLRARIEAGARANWLLFGERSAIHDHHYAEDIHAWQRDGWLTRVDLAFSRNGKPHRCYVQHLLETAADMLRTWVANGASLYICGSLHGMAQEVDATIERILGPDLRQHLQQQGRYRRDVY
ncbi:sulfite reductase subunit alpha [Xylella taiwanensis]|nr:sulfite reductase subunit alpha [Xylella taiwanensis]